MHMPRRFVLGTLILTLMLGAGASAAAWWYQADAPGYRLRQGQEALRRGRPDLANRFAKSLEADGYANHARLLPRRSISA